MNILLLNPPGNEFVRAGSRWPHRRKLLTKRGLYFPFPFALAYAGARLKQAGHTVAIKDCPVLQWDITALLQFISSFSPGLIIMETSAPSFSADMDTVKQLKGTPLCAAGFHATALPRQHLDAGFDYVFCGEYEYLIADFVESLEGKSALPPYVGTVANPAPVYAPILDNLDLLPYPLRDELPLKQYHDPFSRGFNITLLSSKGCTHACSFCSLAPYIGKTKYRTRNVAQVVDEMLYLVKRYHPSEILFDDDTLTVQPAHLIALCREICERVRGISWSCMGNVPVSEECATWMAKAGCRAIKLGVESGIQSILDTIPKGITLKQIKETFATLRRHRIKRHATIMIGLPGDTKKTVMETVKFVLSLNPDTVQFSTATPYPGTVFYKIAQKNGWLVNNSYEEFNGAGTTPLSYPEFSKHEIESSYRKGLRMWHRFMLLHKPQTILHHLKNYLSSR
ncbi:MAG TPA: radical SAM protein [Chitinivibrionales bacterium]|nr:radical SAM protein [Chitinivibrionales bacterium]